MDACVRIKIETAQHANTSGCGAKNITPISAARLQHYTHDRKGAQ
jgi:hypothetical protein